VVPSLSLVVARHNHDIRGMPDLNRRSFDTRFWEALMHALPDASR